MGLFLWLSQPILGVHWFMTARPVHWGSEGLLLSQRSLEDEINRTTAQDLPIFAVSYLVIFLYIALALGSYSRGSRVLVRAWGIGWTLEPLGLETATVDTPESPLRGGDLWKCCPQGHKRLHSVPGTS